MSDFIASVLLTAGLCWVGWIVFVGLMERMP
jgi:hypothetical protein